MTWITWSRTWATTRRTTTASRKPRWCSSKIVFWKRIYLPFASRSKAEARPQRRISASSSTKNYTQWGKKLDRYWTSKLFLHRLSSVQAVEHSLRHGNLLREDDWAIEFWRFEDYLRNHFEQSQHWSDDKRNFKIQDAISLIFITGQCINSERFLRVQLSHRMCNQLTLHHEFRIDTGRTNFEQKGDGILHVCGILWTKNTKILIQSTWKHRVLQYLQTAWKKHQNTVYWIDIRSAQKKGLKF